MLPSIRESEVPPAGVEQIRTQLDRLRQKTEGRVLRSDSGFPKVEDLARLSRSDREGFRQRGEETDLYVEITVTE